MNLANLIPLWQLIPWGQILVRGDFVETETTHTQVVRATPAPQPARTIPQTIEKPGCTAAEACVDTLGCLDALSDGLGGFGILALQKERMIMGAVAADQFGKPDVAQQMRVIADRLPEVRDPEAARMMAQELKPVRDQAWRMGRACGLTHR